MGDADAETERAKAIAEGKAAEALVRGQDGGKAGSEARHRSSQLPGEIRSGEMAIISAGVIMNVIFAVIMAALAFKLGVKSPPAVVGIAAPGSPAWLAGLQPGDKIVQFGRNGIKSENLSFRDITKQVAFNRAKSELQVLVQHPDGREDWHSLAPAPNPKKPHGAKCSAFWAPAPDGFRRARLSAVARHRRSRRFKPTMRCWPSMAKNSSPIPPCRACWLAILRGR